MARVLEKRSQAAAAKKRRGGQFKFPEPVGDPEDTAASNGSEEPEAVEPGLSVVGSE
jgi:hypothetical protein